MIPIDFNIALINSNIDEGYMILNTQFDNFIFLPYNDRIQQNISPKIRQDVLNGLIQILEISRETKNMRNPLKNETSK